MQSQFWVEASIMSCFNAKSAPKLTVSTGRDFPSPGPPRQYPHGRRPSELASHTVRSGMAPPHRPVTTA